MGMAPRLVEGEAVTPAPCFLNMVVGLHVVGRNDGESFPRSQPSSGLHSFGTCTTIAVTTSLGKLNQSYTLSGHDRKNF